MTVREQEKETFDDVLGRAPGIETAYTGWQTAREDLARWEEIAIRFREYEGQRAAPRTEIDTARAYLEAEINSLKAQQTNLETALADQPALTDQLATAQEAQAAAQAQVDQKDALESALRTAQEEKAAAVAENPRLKAEMERLKSRIDQLERSEGALCPLCGQPLSPEDRQKLIDELSEEGKERGDRFRANRKLLDETDQNVKDLEAKIFGLRQANEDLMTQTRVIDQYQTRLEAINIQEKTWETEAGPRLTTIESDLKEGNYAHEAYARLAEIDAELKEIGYDAPSHDAARQAEIAGRVAEEEYRGLENARATLAPLKREINELREQIGNQTNELEQLQQDYERAAASLAESESPRARPASCRA